MEGYADVSGSLFSRGDRVPPVIAIVVEVSKSLSSAQHSSLSVEEAERELDAFAARWDEEFPCISVSWRKHWPNLITLFEYPDDIRKAIYTTNAIESLNSVIRKAVNNRKVFPTDQSEIKVVYLAIQAASKKWMMPIHHWKNVMNRFMIEYPDRIPGQL